MQPKMRILSALKGEAVDRVPWSPFLAYWWDVQSEMLKALGQMEFMQSIGADPMLRGMGAAWRMARKDVLIKEYKHLNQRQTVYETPIGKLVATHTYSPNGDTWFLTGHPVTKKEDIKVLSWIYEHTYIIDNIIDLEKQIVAVGESGLIMPIIGSECKTCFQSLVEHWIGTEQLCYMLADEPEAVEELLLIMRSVSRKTVTLSAQSKGEAFIFWEDSSTTNISPSMFTKYTLPEIDDWANVLHEQGKLLVHHACGHLNALLPLIAQSKIDVLESASPPPTGNVTMVAIRAQLPQHIALIGGIEPVFFENCTLTQLEQEVKSLLVNMASTRFVLANSDSCPPGVCQEKLMAVSKWL